MGEKCHNKIRRCEATLVAGWSTGYRFLNIGRRGFEERIGRGTRMLLGCNWLLAVMGKEGKMNRPVSMLVHLKFPSLHEYGPIRSFLRPVGQLAIT